jgi:hypothetical protein
MRGLFAIAFGFVILVALSAYSRLQSPRLNACRSICHVYYGTHVQLPRATRAPQTIQQQKNKRMN